MPSAAPFLLEPQHVHAGVNTAEDYERCQRAAIRQGQQLYPNLPWREPWANPAQLPVFISGGKLLVECECGNCPSVSARWGGIARCLDCGAVYQGLELPQGLAEIAEALIVRPRLNQRYWAPGMGVLDLWIQNIVSGWINAEDERIPIGVRQLLRNRRERDEQERVEREAAAAAAVGVEETITVEAVDAGERQGE